MNGRRTYDPSKKDRHAGEKAAGAISASAARSLLGRDSGAQRYQSPAEAGLSEGPRTIRVLHEALGNQAVGRLIQRTGAGRRDSEPIKPLEGRSQAVCLNGRPAFGSLDEADEIFIGGGPSPPMPAPAPGVPTPSPPSPAAPSPVGKVGCPADIKVAAVGTLQMDQSFAKAGWLTGWGGFAQMEVSGKGGKDWAGAAIHENLTNIKNTCEETKACSNAAGEGGKAGSTFEVGKGGEFLGLFKLPAEKNRFWDLHVIGMKGVSLLHKLGKAACEIQCRQYYDCGGRRLGPDFIVTYLMKQDVIKSGGTSYKVTRIELNKEAKKEKK